MSASSVGAGWVVRAAGPHGSVLASGRWRLIAVRASKHFWLCGRARRVCVGRAIMSTDTFSCGAHRRSPLQRCRAERIRGASEH